MATIQPSYDITLSDGSTDLGLMLSQDENGSPRYYSGYDTFLTEQFFTGKASYDNINPVKNLTIKQESWHAGFGQKTYFDENSYRTSNGIDCRTKGKFKLFGSENAATVTLGSAPAVGNSGFETWIDDTTLDVWTLVSGAAICRKYTEKHLGTYC